VIKNGVSGAEAEAAVDQAATDAESENRGFGYCSRFIGAGNSSNIWTRGDCGRGWWVWVSKDSDNEDSEATEAKHKRRKKMSKDCKAGQKGGSFLDFHPAVIGLRPSRELILHRDHRALLFGVPQCLFAVIRVPATFS
jgi:hypothetical protein